MTFIRKHLNIIIIITIIIILGAILALKTMLVKASSIEEVLEEQVQEIVEEDKKEEKEPETIKYFKVDIKGQVNKPGVYSLNEESRVIDVIKLASGLTKNADTSTINLAKKITDEMVIIIYSKEEVKNSKKTQTEEIKECICPTIENKAIIENNTNKESSDQTSTKINPNTASLEELQEIPGIGKTKAEAIIKYRKIQPFNKIEELLNVDGIGETTYEKIKNYFTLP